MFTKSILIFSIAGFVCCGAVLGQRGGKAAQLPDGNGKDLVEKTCTQCHALNLVTNAGYNRQDWEQVFTAMAKLPNDQIATIADYLAKNFPEKAKNKAVIIPGNVKVTIKEWMVPSPG